MHLKNGERKCGYSKLLEASLIKFDPDLTVLGRQYKRLERQQL